MIYYRRLRRSSTPTRGCSRRLFYAKAQKHRTCLPEREKKKECVRSASAKIAFNRQLHVDKLMYTDAREKRIAWGTLTDSHAGNLLTLIATSVHVPAIKANIAGAKTHPLDQWRVNWDRFYLNVTRTHNDIERDLRAPTINPTGSSFNCWVKFHKRVCAAAQLQKCS